MAKPGSFLVCKYHGCTARLFHFFALIHRKDSKRPVAQHHLPPNVDSGQRPVVTVLSPVGARAAWILLSIVLDPTVSIHGASLTTVPSEGPPFPAEELTSIPFLAAS
ncbi:contactin-associated protein like 5-3 [Striga asiatica]|uniref:Contactin-associated protein like 5-3 n=1 Tax=Striga asiatica TaxID=4170 RepID=A0A5A7QGK7_STRAF|nr:contactin-associated protein like 5-3 [Striga asiatica]